MKSSASILTAIALASTFVTPASAQWAQSLGVYGGHVQSLSVHGSALFAGTHGDGVYRSLDDGANCSR